MWFRRRSKKNLQNKSRSYLARRASSRPAAALESLEDRRMLAVSALNAGGAAGGIGNGSSFAFTANAGNDRLLLVKAAVDQGNVTGVTFDGNPLSFAVSSDGVSIWRLELGSGGAITDQVTFSTTGSAGGLVQFDVYQGVNQSDPIDAATTASVGVGATSSSVSLPSEVGDLVSDAIAVTSSTGFPTLSAGPGNTGSSGGGGAGGLFTMGGRSTRSGLNGSTSMQWTIANNLPTQATGHVAVNVNQIHPAEIDVEGNGTSIADGDTTPASGDHTDFGSVAYSSGSITRTFTVQNENGAGDEALSLTGSPRVQISGADASAFTVTTLPSASIAAGGSSTFMIEFDPSEFGIHEATVTIQNNDSDEGTYTFDIQGIGTGPAIVTNTNDSGAGSLRQAVLDTNAVPGADEIEFDPGLANSTITLTSGNLQINDSVTIQGLGADQLTIDGNGGSIFSLDGANADKTFTINDLTLTGAVNTINMAGSNLNDELYVNRVVATGNADSNSAGSVMVASFGSVFVTDTAIVNNQHNGHAFDISSGSATFTNVTISDNDGNAISIFPGSNLTNSLSLLNVTIADNGGAGVEVRSVPATTTLTVEYENSIFADNTDGNFTTSTVDGTLNLSSQGRNILDDASDPNPDATDLQNADPMIGSLEANNGTFVHPLLPGSPAIDQIALGNAPTFDQRGFARVDGNNNGVVTADIGAFEFSPFIYQIAGVDDVTLLYDSGSDEVRVVDTSNTSTILSFVDKDDIDGFVAINGDNDDNTLTVDPTFHSLGLDVEYNGDGEANSPNGDSLVVQGSGSEDAVYTPDATTTGNGTVVVSDGGTSSTITFTGLEPVDITGMATATLSLPLTGGNDTLAIDEDFDFGTGLIDAIRVSGTTGDSAKGAADGVVIETVAFYGNGEVIIDTTVTDGDDVINVNSAANAHDNTDLTILTGTGDDEVNINGDVTLVNGTIATPDGNADLRIETQNITLGDGVGIDTITVTDTVSLDAGTGAIVDGMSHTINAVNLVMDATTGIGDASTDGGDIDGNVTNLAARTVTGDISFEDLDGELTITDLTLLGTATTISGVSVTTGGVDDDILIRKRDGTVGDDDFVVSSPVVNSGAGDITLVANADDTDDDLEIAANITASGGDILLVSYEDIESTASGVTISTTGEGNVALHAGALYTFGAPVDTDGGDADGDIFLGTPNDGTVQSDDGDILLTANDNILLGRLNADADNDRTGAMADPGNGDVTVRADEDDSGAGFIEDALSGEGIGNENIIGNTVTLSAATGIGSDSTGADLDDDSDIDIDAVGFSATNDTSGAIQIFEVNDIGLMSVDNADGTLTDPDGFTIIDAGGAITDKDTTDDSTKNITSERIILRALTGIGDASIDLGDIDIDGEQLAAQTDTGDIAIEEMSDSAANAGLELDALNAQTGFTNSVEILTGGAGDEILIREGAVAGQTDLFVVADPVVNNGPGDITLVADGTDDNDDFDLQANVTASGGDVLIVSYEDIETEVSGVTISTTDEGNISLHAGATFSFGMPIDTDAGDPDGDIFLGGPNDGIVQTDDGDILLTATDNILLGRLNADADNDRTGAMADPGNGDVTVRADEDDSGVGDIRDELAGEDAGNENIIGNTVRLRAATGIGADFTPAVGDDSDIDIDAVGLVATNTDDGAIQIFEVNDVGILDDVLAGDNDRIENIGRTVILDAGGKITDKDGADDTNANIVALDLAIRAATGIGMTDMMTAATDTMDIDTEITNLAATTVTGDISISDDGGLNITEVGNLSGASITTGGADDDILIRNGSAGSTVFDVLRDVTNAGTGDVTLVQLDDGDMDIEANVTGSGGDVQLISVDDVEITDADLDDSAITISTTGTGNIEILAAEMFNFGSTTTFSGDTDGDVFMDEDVTVSTEDGNMVLVGSDDVQLATLDANSDNDGTLGTVFVIADSDATGVGGISDVTTAEDANITALAVSLSAGDGIGDGAVSGYAPGVSDGTIDDTDIDLETSTIAARTDSGDIALENGDLALEIGTIAGLAFSKFGTPATIMGLTIEDTIVSDDSGADDITVVNGTATITANDDVINNDGGDIRLRTDDDAFGVTENIAFGAGVTIESSPATGSSEIFLEAGDDMTVPDSVTVQAGDEVTFETDFNNFGLNDGSGGFLSIEGGTQNVGGNAGPITINLFSNENNDTARVDYTRLRGVDGLNIDSRGNSGVTTTVVTGGEVFNSTTNVVQDGVTPGLEYNQQSELDPNTIMTNVEIGDTVLLNDGGQSNNTTYRFTDAILDRSEGTNATHASVETFRFTGSEGNNVFTADDSATPLAQDLPRLQYTGGSMMDHLVIAGTDGDDFITIGDVLENHPITVEGIECVQVMGGDGNDVILNNTSFNSIIDGGNGNDILVGGEGPDAIFGGAGVDALFGRGGNDFLFSDEDLLGNEFNDDGDLLHGGLGIDSADQQGVDQVKQVEILEDGGAEKSVLFWLRGIIGDVDREDAFEAVCFPALTIQNAIPALDPGGTTDLGVIDMNMQMVDLTAVGGFELFTFTPMHQPGFLTIEADYDPADGTILELFLFDQNGTVVVDDMGEPVGYSSDYDGNERIDFEIEDTGVSYTVGLLGDNTDVKLTITNALTQNSPLTIHGTEGDDVVSITTGASSMQIVYNGVPYEFDNASTESVTFLGNGGHDTFMVDGIASTEFTVHGPGSTTLTGSPTEIHTAGVEQVDYLLNGALRSYLSSEVETFNWQNEQNPADVDASGVVTLNDALLIVSEIRRGGVRNIAPQDPGAVPTYFDTNGDGLLTLADAMLVIAEMRSLAGAGAGEASSSEGESDSGASADSSLADEGEASTADAYAALMAEQSSDDNDSDSALDATIDSIADDIAAGWDG